MDQGDLAMEGGVVAPFRPWLTPLRALLLLLGAVLCGVALSMLLGSSPAHAATDDGDGSGSGSNQVTIGSATNALLGTVTATVDQTVPIVQHTVRAAGGTVTAAIPATSPIVAPVVTTVDATLTTVRQLISPAVPELLTALPAAAVQQIVITTSPTTALPGVAQADVSDFALPFGSSPDGTPSSPTLTSSSGTPLAPLGVLFALAALMLAASRRRLDDDALPASPVFETDTSPA